MVLLQQSTLDWWMQSVSSFQAQVHRKTCPFSSVRWTFSVSDACIPRPPATSRWWSFMQSSWTTAFCWAQVSRSDQIRCGNESHFRGHSLVTSSLLWWSWNLKTWLCLQVLRSWTFNRLIPFLHGRKYDFGVTVPLPDRISPCPFCKGLYEAPGANVSWVPPSRWQLLKACGHNLVASSCSLEHRLWE